MTDRTVIVAAHAESGELLGAVAVEVEAAGDNLHDAGHAILQAAYGIGEGDLNIRVPGPAVEAWAFRVNVPRFPPPVPDGEPGPYRTKSGRALTDAELDELNRLKP